jgi:hypothetical protein
MTMTAKPNRDSSPGQPRYRPSRWQLWSQSECRRPATR